VTRGDSGSADGLQDSQEALFDLSEIPGAEALVGTEGASGDRGGLGGPEADTGPGDIGYRGPTACSAAGITYRFRDILVLKVVKRLLDTGISLQQIRAAVQHLRDHGTDDLAEVTLMSDGVSVYECTSADEVVDLLAGGQGVFGIALGRVWREVEGDLAVLPAVRAEDPFVAVVPEAAGGLQDDLAKRRLRRTSLVPGAMVTN
jgi:DNA-binding transcriptional MerR regulator